VQGVSQAVQTAAMSAVDDSQQSDAVTAQSLAEHRMYVLFYPVSQLRDCCREAALLVRVWYYLRYFDQDP
jgi:hypothetical protein